MKPTNNKILRIAIFGRTNIGKTSLIEAITGNPMHIGNFEGTTNEIGEVYTKLENSIICIYDLPGISQGTRLKDFFLKPPPSQAAKDQEIAANFLKNEENYDILVYIIDAHKIEDELCELNDLKDIKKPVILAINLISNLEDEGTKLNLKHIERQLNIILLNAEDAIKGNDSTFLNTVIKSSQHTNGTRIFNCEEKTSKDIKNYVKDAKSLVQEKKYSAKNVTKVIDSFMLNGFLGIPIFIATMGLAFYATFNLGEMPSKIIGNLMTRLSEKLASLMPVTFSVYGRTVETFFIKALIKDGIGAGITAVMEFLPKILIMTFFILLIELSGYMSRISVLFYTTLKKFGLQGKSMIPIINGFGCTVPAILSTRILPTKLDRFVTSIATTFIPCHAKMIVFIFFSNVFFKKNATYAMIIIYSLGISLAFLFAKIAFALNKRSSNSKFPPPSISNLPQYRIPNINHISKILFKRIKTYSSGVFTLILTASIAIWLSSNIPLNFKDKQYWKYSKMQTHSPDLTTNSIRTYLLENSILGRTSKLISPIFAPMGMDWRLSTSIATAFMAKEIALTTISILYSGQEDYISELQKNVSIPTASAYIAFLIVWVPCLSALLTFYREKNGFYKISTIFITNTCVAWLFSFLTYNLLNKII